MARDTQVKWLRPCTRVYLVMLALTLATYTIGVSGARGVKVSLLVLGFALIKGQMVGDYFMGLKGVRGLWRWVIFLWLSIPGALITAAFALAG
ncbi:MAG: cytochrome C oxidase subunit IV family protein [Chromatiaceae bacterium]